MQWEARPSPTELDSSNKTVDLASGFTEPTRTIQFPWTSMAEMAGILVEGIKSHLVSDNNTLGIIGSDLDLKGLNDGNNISNRMGTTLKGIFHKGSEARYSISSVVESSSEAIGGIGYIATAGISNTVNLGTSSASNKGSSRGSNERSCRDSNVGINKDPKGEISRLSGNNSKDSLKQNSSRDGKSQSTTLPNV